ncbi:MAG TPA: biopolymer transporter ExbD [Pyrinomonadaceae bacterium]|nr:biopolymer transporter ExbD [Pyrinomonadaceae bacterium]
MSKPVINVTPLIDVLLVLLIIFMVITPVKPSRFEAKIPSELKSDSVPPDPHILVVSVDAARNLAINSEKRDASIDAPAAMIDRLKEIFRQRETNLENEKTVFVKAPQNMDYGSVAKVIDAVKMSGAYPISLQIDRLDR